MNEILIKGISMPPEGCAYEVRIRGNGAVVDAKTGMKMGTAVELPLHEDLIERTWLDDYASEFITEKDRRIGTYDWVEDMIEDAPTILEASEVSK